MIGDHLCNSEEDLMWENWGTLQDISVKKASLQTTNIILTPENTDPRVTHQVHLMMAGRLF